jgi:NAD(P)-dependent dehydrogenase (short-subunit alcohol dehydrogenase family)
MRLVLGDIEPQPLSLFAEELRAAGTQVVSERVDVARAADLETLAEQAYAQFGAVHVLCNNAGIFPPGAPVWKEPLSTWRWTLDVNFFGVLHGVQAFVPRMLQAGQEAHIVNTASVAGLTTRPLMSAYNVSKHAVVAISECLFSELRLNTDKIGVSVLCPAWAKTRLAESTRNKPPGVEADPDASFGFFDTLKHVVEEGTPPEEIADAVVDAIRAAQFWVIVPDKADAGVRERCESILNRRNPGVRDLRARSTPLL